MSPWTLSNRSPGVIAIQSSSFRKAVPPGIESKFGPITPDVDTPAEKALPPGIELNVDRGKLPGKETVVPDDDDEQTEPASDDPR